MEGECQIGGHNPHTPSDRPHSDLNFLRREGKSRLPPTTLTRSAVCRWGSLGGCALSVPADSAKGEEGRRRLKYAIRSIPACITQRTRGRARKRPRATPPSCNTRKSGQVRRMPPTLSQYEHSTFLSKSHLSKVDTQVKGSKSKSWTKEGDRVPRAIGLIGPKWKTKEGMMGIPLARSSGTAPMGLANWRTGE